MYIQPQAGASLLLAFSSPSAAASTSAAPPQHNTLLILSPTRLAAVRTFAALEAGYSVVIGASPLDKWDEELIERRSNGQISTVDFSLGARADRVEWETWLDALPTSVKQSCMLILLTDTMPTGDGRERRAHSSAVAFRSVANSKRYLVNVADGPSLSDFSWPVTHRFDLASSHTASTTTITSPTSPITIKSPLQLAIYTNSSACRLASRLRREIVASLPPTIGSAVLAISELRSALSQPSEKGWSEAERENDEGVELSGVGLNKPVEQLSKEMGERLDKLDIDAERNSRAMRVTEEAERGLSPCRARALSNRRASQGAFSLGEGSTSSLASSFASSTATTISTTSHAADWTASEAQRTRMRYVSQISEYWPLERLASVTLSSLSAPTTPISTMSSTPNPFASIPSMHSLSIEPLIRKQGRIILLGAGTGSTLLLTRLAYLFLTSPIGSPYYVDLFLVDKLVPSHIVELIPAERRAGVIIARKFPGNAENAQDELMRLGVEGAMEGKTVLRMKQGDPFLYGRGGEEVLHFRAAGFDPIVIPALSSCIAGPTIAGIPVTQRGVAETMVVCTGVGRGGRDVAVEGYERGKTLTVLMGVARLDALVESLVKHPKSPYPPYLPIALIERASSPDQRVVSATIETLSGVLARLSPHRPPGMLVIGWGVMCLEGTDGKGDMDILDCKLGEGRDRRRVSEWLGEAGYRVKEGLGEGWRSITEGMGEH